MPQAVRQPCHVGRFWDPWNQRGSNLYISVLALLTIIIYMETPLKKT